MNEAIRPMKYRSHTAKKENDFKITVGELKEYLNDFDDNDIVMLSSDEEGNNYRELYEVCNGLKTEDNDIISGENYEKYWNVTEEYNPCIILY